MVTLEFLSHIELSGMRVSTCVNMVAGCVFGNLTHWDTGAPVYTFYRDLLNDSLDGISVGLVMGGGVSKRINRHDFYGHVSIRFMNW